MSRKFLVPIDLVQNELQNGVIQNLGTGPGSPLPGQIYFDSTLNRPYVWNGSAWQWKATDSDLLQGQNGAYYLNRTNHTGSQSASTISNFAAAANALTLDSFAAPVANVSLNGQKIVNLGTPTNPNDGANKQYVDNLAQGFTAKPTAMVATAAALPTCTYANGTAGVGATLTASAVGVLTVDGYTVNLGDIILVKNQAAAAQNGLYNVTTLGTASVPFILTRNADMDQSTEFGGGFVPVENNGATTGNSLWLCNIANVITVGTTAVAFTQLNSPTAYTGSSSINISANVVAAIVAASGGVVIGSGGLALDTSIAVRKYAAAIGDGTSTSITVTHNLGTQDVTTGLYSATAPFAEVVPDVNHATTNTITLIFAVAPTLNQYRVVVHG